MQLKRDTDLVCTRLQHHLHSVRNYMNKSLLLVNICWLLMLTACDINNTVNNDSISDEEERVLAVEDAYVAAEINRDEDALRRILDDRFVFNSNDGTTSGKVELISTILSWKMTGQTITERTVLVDGDTAVIFGTTELRFASETGEDTKSLLRYTSTYVKRQGQWRFLALQMARRTP